MNIFNKFKSNISGNIAVLFGVALVPIMMSVGMAIDYSKAANLHSRVAAATDSALLAAASTVLAEVDLDDTVAVNAKLNEIFEPYFLANLGSITGYQYHGNSITYDPAARNISVNVNVDYETVVFKVFGRDTLGAGVNAATNMEMKAGGAISMFLVLDRSGSMGWSNGSGGTKMESLQTAVDSMVIDLKIADPDKEFIRMGAVAYSSFMWSVQNIRWNLNKANNYVQAMSAGGGTDSSDAVAKAYNKLKKPSELTAHMSKNGQVPDLVMVFMTDGDNNDPADDTKTLNTCTQAKNYGIEVYTVAFQAPANGQALLSACATDAAHYFEPEDTQALIDAFSNIGANVGDKLVLTH